MTTPDTTVQPLAQRIANYHNDDNVNDKIIPSVYKEQAVTARNLFSFLSSDRQTV